ncbi:MAG: glutamate-5-semialdehyde dehydrogenase [Chloroflexi bacterium]|nr:glutamate-5-semialdehyde dehydrogenase [Chloroflexota bacterium]
MTTTTSAVQHLREQAKAAKAASRQLAKAGTAPKNKALLKIADNLKAREEEILAANEQDYAGSKRGGMSETMLDRLRLDPKRLADQADDVRRIADLPDPVGEVFDAHNLPNGLRIGKRRVPLGVLATIYESRPNVTIDISALCLKSGNAVILRGGKEAFHSNKALAAAVRDAVVTAGLPGDAVQFVESTDREMVNELLKMREYVDLMVPRGGADLIHFIADNATMPVLAGGIGVCHTYVDASADVEMAKNIVFNAKVQRPSVCNAMDTLIIHKDIAAKALPVIGKAWAAAGVEMRCDPKSLAVLKQVAPAKVKPAADSDFGFEFLALVASVKVVESLDEAIAFIERYGSGHSEAIVTSDYRAANKFVDEVDAGSVYVNASTRFTDGGQFGLGAEVGISTQKFHARGPMGLRELTSYKWTIFGDGHVRP